MGQPEKILCAAIDFNGTIIPGHRHGDCYQILRDLIKGITDAELPGREKQGFLTSENRYVNRKEGWEIAIKNGQVIYGKEASDKAEDSILISENLY